jgi:acyl dehydratase
MATIFMHPGELLKAVGQGLGQSDWFPIDRARVERFADATNSSARTQPGTAPEYLILSLVNVFLPQLLEVRGISMGINVGCENVRYPAPVPVPSRIRGCADLIDAREERGSIQVVVRMTVELEGSDLPACIAETISRYYPE